MKRRKFLSWLSKFSILGIIPIWNLNAQKIDAQTVTDLIPDSKMEVLSNKGYTGIIESDIYKAVGKSGSIGCFFDATQYTDPRQEVVVEILLSFDGGNTFNPHMIATFNGGSLDKNGSPLKEHHMIFQWSVKDPNSKGMISKLDDVLIKSRATVRSGILTTSFKLHQASL